MECASSVEARYGSGNVRIQYVTEEEARIDDGGIGKDNGIVIGDDVRDFRDNAIISERVCFRQGTRSVGGIEDIQVIGDGGIEGRMIDDYT